jgi:AcrR family transcriptional regulator
VMSDAAAKVDGRDRVSMRSAGVQTRSRDRVELLLNAAALLVAEGGMDALKMRELARRAGLPIASVYHYFPSASAVLRELALRHLEDMRVFLDARLSLAVLPGLPPEERAKVAGEMTRDVLDYLMRSQAINAAIWDGLRANPELRALDMEDSARNAAALEPFLGWIAPNLPEAQLPDMALVLLEAIQSNYLLILRSPPDRVAALTDRLEDLVVAMLRGLQG